MWLHCWNRWLFFIFIISVFCHWNWFFLSYATFQSRNTTSHKFLNLRLPHYVLSLITSFIGNNLEKRYWALAQSGLCKFSEVHFLPFYICLAVNNLSLVVLDERPSQDCTRGSFFSDMTGMYIQTSVNLDRYLFFK